LPPPPVAVIFYSRPPSFFQIPFSPFHCRKLKLYLDKCLQKAMDAKLIQLEAVNLAKKLADGDTACKACIVKYKLKREKSTSPTNGG